VRRIADEKVANAHQSLTVLPESKEREYLNELVEFFVTRSF